MEATDRLIEALYDRQGFWALEELADVCGVDAAGLNARIEQLRAQGCHIEHSPSSGIRLSRPVRLMPRLIERNLNTLRIGRHVICFDDVDSTNDVAATAGAGHDMPDGLVVTAEFQRNGRGRQGRQWLSPRGANILASCLLDSARHDLPAQAVPIAAGLALAEAVDEVYPGLQCSLKWPNDVLIDGQKLAGVLVETRAMQHGQGIIIGMGINCNAAPQAETRRPSTSLAEQTGSPVERIDVLRAVLKRLDAWMLCLADGQIEALHQSWLAHCRMINQRLTVRWQGRSVTGRVMDVSPMDGLVLLQDNGQVVHIPAGGASIEP